MRHRPSTFATILTYLICSAIDLSINKCRGQGPFLLVATILLCGFQTSGSAATSVTLVPREGTTIDYKGGRLDFDIIFTLKDEDDTADVASFRTSYFADGAHNFPNSCFIDIPRWISSPDQTPRSHWIEITLHGYWNEDENVWEPSPRITDRVTIIQTVTPPLTISPTEIVAAQEGESGDLVINAAEGENWSIFGNEPDWITFSQTTGKGPTTIRYTIDPNDTGNDREAAGGYGVTFRSDDANARRSDFFVEQPAGGPELSLTGEQAFEGKLAEFDNSAVNQLYFYEGDEMIFRINYESPSELEPENGYPRLQIFRYNYEMDQYQEFGGSMQMTHVAGNATEAMIFEKRLSHLPVGSYRYAFEAMDSEGIEATEPGYLVDPPRAFDSGIAQPPTLLIWNYRVPEAAPKEFLSSICSIGGQGTGFLIGPGYVLTAYHTVAGKNGLKKGDQISYNFNFALVPQHDGSSASPYIGKSYYPKYPDASKVFVGATVVSDPSDTNVGHYSDKQLDWVVLKLNDWDSSSRDHKSLGFLDLQFTNEPQTGFALGYPSPTDSRLNGNSVSVQNPRATVGFTFRDHLLEQYVPGTSWVQINHVGLFGNDHWRSTAFDGHHGNSGGPFISTNGEVCGIVVGVKYLETQQSWAGDVLTLSAIGESNLRPFIGHQDHLLADGGRRSVSGYAGSGSTEALTPIDHDSVSPQVFDGLIIIGIRITAPDGFRGQFAALSTEARVNSTQAHPWTLRFYNLGYPVEEPASAKVFQVNNSGVDEIETTYVSGYSDSDSFWVATVPGPGDYFLGVQTENDTDGDGLDDKWELDNFGDLATADGTADPDFDGRSNLLEFALSTHPMVSQSSPATLMSVGSTLSLSYTRGEPSKFDYHVEVTTDLTDSGAWTTDGVDQGIPAGDGTTTATVDVSERPAFLRLRVEAK